MIIGNGLIATEFNKVHKDFKNYVVFAAGVSDSKEVRDEEFKREKDLILKTISENPNLKFIYFSSILAEIVHNKYYLHNMEMIELIKSKAKSYVIFNLPQIIGKTGNSNNLINYLRYNIKHCNTITIDKNVTRSLIDVEDVVKIVNHCKGEVDNEIVNISEIEKIDVISLAERISDIIKPNALFLSHKNGMEAIDEWEIENSEIITNSIKYLGIEPKGYIIRALKKYIKK